MTLLYSDLVCIEGAGQVKGLISEILVLLDFHSTVPALVKCLATPLFFQVKIKEKTSFFRTITVTLANNAPLTLANK